MHARLQGFLRVESYIGVRSEHPSISESGKRSEC